MGKIGGNMQIFEQLKRFTWGDDDVIWLQPEDKTKRQRGQKIQTKQFFKSPVGDGVLNRDLYGFRLCSFRRIGTGDIFQDPGSVLISTSLPYLLDLLTAESTVKGTGLPNGVAVAAIFIQMGTNVLALGDKMFTIEPNTIFYVRRIYPEEVSGHKFNCIDFSLGYVAGEEAFQKFKDDKNVSIAKLKHYERSN